MTVLFEKRDVPTVSIAFAVRIGGVNELSSERGISHFIEHLLYKGTLKRNSRQIAEEIEKRGGVLNGFTDELLTAYWCKLPNKHLLVALDVLSDMVQNPLFDEKEILKERDVIFEEIKMYKDNPLQHSFQEVQRLLYKDPLGSPLIGTESTLHSLSRKKILERFNQFYHPQNMVLCVVGNADFRKILDFAEKNFQKKSLKIKTSKPKILIRNGFKKEKRKGIDQANFVFGYHVPKVNSKKSYAAFALNVLMTGGMSSRLFHEIREKRNLAYGVGGGSEINKEFAYNMIYVGTKKENVDQVKKIILEEFRKVSESLEEKELVQIKEQIIGNHYLSQEDSKNQMVNLLLHEINGDAKELYDFERNIMGVKLADVKKLAREAYKKHSFFSLVPY